MSGSVGLAGSAYRSLLGLELFKVAALHQIDRTNLASRQLSGLNVSPHGNVRHPQFFSGGRQDHVGFISHALRIRAAVKRITRNPLYKDLCRGVKYVKRITGEQTP